METKKIPLNYANYLAIEELLSLQNPRSSPPEHDEMLFIIIHQTYELWFKQLIHELEKIMRDLSANDLFGAIHTFKRCRTIMKTLVGQLDILETMTPRSFNSFRDRLDKASGFQSHQFRDVEFMLGYKRPELLKHFTYSDDVLALLQARLDAPSMQDHFYDFLAQRGVAIPLALRARPVEAPGIPDEDIQDGLVDLYNSSPEAGILFELMTDFDEGLQEWRYRHVVMVKRTIGEKRGTGGSLGVDFLKKSLFQPVFADLWAIRHRF